MQGERNNMCAINPTYKKRFIIDVYTSLKDITEEQFKDEIIDILLSKELELNETFSKFRFHLKDSDEQAE